LQLDMEKKYQKKQALSFSTKNNTYCNNLI
jgi:hypothetical protein